MHLPPDSPLLAPRSLEENLIAYHFEEDGSVPMRLQDSPIWETASETRKKRLGDAVAVLGWDAATREVGWLLSAMRLTNEQGQNDVSETDLAVR